MKLNFDGLGWFFLLGAGRTNSCRWEWSETYKAVPLSIGGKSTGGVAEG